MESTACSDDPISMPSLESLLVNLMVQALNGNYDYALAA